MPALVSTCSECSGLSVHHVRIHFSCVSSARAGVELSWSSTSGMSCCRVQWCPVQLAAGARYCGGPWDACHCFTHARAARVLPRCARIKGVRVAAAVGISGPTAIIRCCVPPRGRPEALAWREVDGVQAANFLKDPGKPDSRGTKKSADELSKKVVVQLTSSEVVPVCVCVSSQCSE